MEKFPERDIYLLNIFYKLLHSETPNVVSMNAKICQVNWEIGKSKLILFFHTSLLSHLRNLGNFVTVIKTKFGVLFACFNKFYILIL